MEKKRRHSLEILILFIMMVGVILLRFKTPYVFTDGKFPIIWVGAGIGSVIGSLVRKDKQCEGAILPLLLVLNYFLFKLDIFIPSYIVILVVLCGVIVYYSLRYSVKNKYFSSLFAIILLIAFFAVNYSAYNKRIFKDVNLDYIVKKELGIKGSISKDDLKGVERLPLSTRYIVNSLEGIENFESLKSLGLWDNVYLIKDLGRISSLEELERLMLWHANLDQLKELHRMESVTHFEIIYPHSGKLSQLIFFPNLEALEMQGLHLENLAALKNLESLEYLSLADGQVKSFDGIEDLQNLKTINMYRLHVSDVDKIFNLKNLKLIKLNNMNIPFREEFDRRTMESGIVIEEFNSLTINEVLEKEVNEFNKKNESSKP